MKSARLFTCILISYLVSLESPGQNLSIVASETFDNNDYGWRFPNTAADKSDILNSKLIWQHNHPDGSSISNYFNLLNSDNDFTVEAKFNIKKAGSEYGLLFGGTDQDNALFLSIKNMQYRILEFKKGKSVEVKPYTTSLKLKPDNNLILISKKGSVVILYVNNNLLAEIPYTIKGKLFGFSSWGSSFIEIDDFLIKGTKLPIDLAPNLYYTTPPENLGAGINSTYGEITPVVTADGKGLYFTRNYSPENKGGGSDYQDVYFSSYSNDKWNKAENIGKPINNDGPNAVCAVSPDGNSVLLMNTYNSQGGTLGMGLSMSYRTLSGWAIPQQVNVRNYYNKSSFNEYFLSSDNKVLLLALERDDTYGTRDIYVSFLEEDGAWSTPKNIGPVVNTPGTELAPFLAADGVTLYFSSTGHPGYGKNDIFISRRLDDSWTNWSKPQNIGSPINTKGVDSYYSIPASGEYAYYVSETSPRNTDIFRIKLPLTVKPKPVVLIHGRVLNSKTKQPISTGITYRNMETDKESGKARSNPSDGSYKITLPYNQAYSFFAEKQGFYSVRDTIDVPDIKEYLEIERDIYLTPLELGQEIPLKNVFFVRSQSTIMPASYPELNKLADILSENPTIEIELEGHTDNVGDPEKNVTLSKQRVEAVKQYLIQKGIAANRITGKGYGGSKPIADNTNEATRKLNRRVEFKIVKF